MIIVMIVTPINNKAIRVTIFTFITSAKEVMFMDVTMDVIIQV